VFGQWSTGRIRSVGVMVQWSVSRSFESSEYSVGPVETESVVGPVDGRSSGPVGRSVSGGPVMVGRSNQ
jgi:hypothetical protein